MPISRNIVGDDELGAIHLGHRESSNYRALRETLLVTITLKKTYKKNYNRPHKNVQNLFYRGRDNLKHRKGLGKVENNNNDSTL